MSTTSTSPPSTMFSAIQRATTPRIFMVFTLIISGLIINTIQFILFYTLRPLNRRLYQHINYYLIYSLHSTVLFIPEWWSNSDIRLYTDNETMKKLGKEDSLLIVNHTYDIDWMLGWLMAERLSMLGGIKCIIKRIIARLPILGWCWSFSDYLFLDRDWEKDRASIEKQCTNLEDYATPSWMTLFPEGTRFTEEKHKVSMEFARKKGIPLLKRHLLPRTKGFVQLVHSLKGHYPAIYDLTISYDLSKSAPPRLISMLDGERVLAEAYLRRYELTDLPEDDDELSEWMHQLFREKDALLDSYLTCGSFTDSSGFPVQPVQPAQRRFISLIPTTVWLFFTAYCLYRAAIATLTYGPIGVFLAGGAIGVAHYGLQKLINVTRTDKGSSYGSGSNKKE